MSTSTITAAIDANLGELRERGALSVRPGYKVVGGWPTRKPAIVVTVEHKTDRIPPAERLPESIGGIAVDVREASPVKRLELVDPARYNLLEDWIPAEQRVARFDSELRLRAPRQPPADPAALTRAADLAAAHAAKQKLPYTPPPGVELSVIEGTFKVTCHASPDAGWPTLSAFLEGTQTRLTVGLYDFTSAHVLKTVETALKGKRLDLVLDHPARNPTADQTDEATQAELAQQLGARLRFAWALDGSDPKAAAAIFANAYHIKVAVRDRKAFWLSSGNWNNSNQPDINPVTTPADRPKAKDGDRDWHVIVEHTRLSRVFSSYLENDLEIAMANQAAALEAPPDVPELESAGPAATGFAEFFAPQTFHGRMRVRPLLTPDPGVYSGAVTDLVQSATKTLYIQTQYAHPSDKAGDKAFMDLLKAVVNRQKAGVDVRIIFSQWEKTSYLEQLQADGFDLAQVRIQHGVHNKGIVADTKAALISSQNWSADGVLRNRDAGVIIEHPGIAAYFEQIFMHDWVHLAHQNAVDS